MAIQFFGSQVQTTSIIFQNHNKQYSAFLCLLKEITSILTWFQNTLALSFGMHINFSSHPPINFLHIHQVSNITTLICEALQSPKAALMLMHDQKSQIPNISKRHHSRGAATKKKVGSAVTCEHVDTEGQERRERGCASGKTVGGKGREKRLKRWNEGGEVRNKRVRGGIDGRGRGDMVQGRWVGCWCDGEGVQCSATGWTCWQNVKGHAPYTNNYRTALSTLYYA